MRFLSKCDLLEKTVVADGGRKLDVLGLASFRTEPRGMGIGRHSLRAMVDIAQKQKKAGVVCFAFPDVKDFYLKCGWYNCGKYVDSKGREKYILSNLCCSIQASEEW